MIFHLCSDSFFIKKDLQVVFLLLLSRLSRERSNNFKCRKSSDEERIIKILKAEKERSEGENTK